MMKTSEDNNLNSKGAKMIIGLDILPFSSPHSRDFKPRIATVVLREDATIVEKIPGGYRLHELSKKIRELARQSEIIIAVDNIFELVAKSSALPTFLRRFPDNVKFVQVTGSPTTGNYVKIKRLARIYNLLPKTGKPTSVETAEIVAKLYILGVGYLLRPFHEEIKVTISRNRSRSGHGGWSAPRYERNLKIGVTQAAKEIKRRLREENIEYDLFQYQRRAVFLLVDTDSVNVLQWLKPFTRKLTTELTQVRVTRLPRRKVEFVPLAGGTSSIPPRSLIIGIDPGTTTGIAIVDFSGRILVVASRREFGLSSAIRMTNSYGKPIVVACDVSRPQRRPKFVERLQRNFGATIIRPSKVVGKEAKREFLRNYGEEVEKLGRMDSHSRDALYAALSAYRNVEKSLTRVKDIVVETDPSLLPFLDEIQGDVVSGTHPSFAIEAIKSRIQAAEALSSIGDTIEPKKSTSQNPPYLDEVLRAERENELLLDEIEYLRELSQDQKNDRILLLRELDKAKRSRSLRVETDKRIRVRDKQIRSLKEELRLRLEETKNLERRIRMLQDLRLIWAQDKLMPLKCISRFVENSIDETEAILGINEGEVVFILDPSGGGSRTAERLALAQVRAILLPETGAKLSSGAEIQFAEDYIPIVRLPVYDLFTAVEKDKLRDRAIFEFDGVFVVDRSILERELRIVEAEMAGRRVKEEKKKRMKQNEVVKRKRVETSHSGEFDIMMLLEEHRKEWQRIMQQKEAEEDHYE